MNVAQRSLSSGELAPALYGRTDLARYATALRTCLNWIVKRSGGVDTRPGLEYIATAKSSATATRLLKFVFNDDQTYVLIFGEHTMRVAKNGVQLESSPGVPYELATPYLGADLFALQYVQSADVITITHHNYATRDLARLGDTNWTLTAPTFAPSIAAPAGVTATGGTSGPTNFWAVTSLKSDTFEESLPSPTDVGASTYAPTPSAAITVTWSAVSGATRYNVYRSTDGTTYSYVGSASGTTFTDAGVTPDDTVSPPRARNPFPSTTIDWPATVGYYQQRRWYGNTISHPETAYGSRTANYNNFTTSFPSQDDDAITFTLVGRQVSEIRHFLDLQKMLVFTSSGVWSLDGDAQGVVTPQNINPRQQSYYGSNAMAPIVVGSSALYVQSRSTIVRDLSNDIVSGVKTSDLTLFSTHLFDGFTLVDWDYQEIPNSVVWVARSDGVLLALTYIPDQQVVGWTRCVTDGIVESVVTVPEGNEDRVYLVVNRNGVRMIERMASRFVADVRDYIGMDSAVSYDGRNTDLSPAGLLTISFGTTWDQYDTVYLVTASSHFSAGDVGNAVFVTAPDGSEVRFTITAYNSPAAVLATPSRTVPLSLRGTGTIQWAKAVDTLSGLDHLEGRAVSVLGDGYVVANPLNESYTVVTVTGGSITLDRPYAVLRVGLPYVCDLETLEIDTPQGPSLRDKKMIATGVSLTVESTRGLFAGQQFPTGDDPLQELYEYKLRDIATATTEPPQLVTDTIVVTIGANWEHNGRIVIRQVDPVPASVLTIIPTGYLPVNG
jgi:hypothetical protein